jgi:hypothetical protein
MTITSNIASMAGLANPPASRATALARPLAATATARARATASWLATDASSHLAALKGARVGRHQRDEGGPAP